MSSAACAEITIVAQSKAAITQLLSAEQDKCGGVCGDTNHGTITNCFNEGTVSGTGDKLGGVCGINSEGVITNCFNKGTVSGADFSVGGVCGYGYGDTTKNCYYLSGTATRGIGGRYDVSGKAEERSKEQFKVVRWHGF